MNGGFLAPVEQVRFVNGAGQATTLLELVQQNSGNNSLDRTDMRFGIGNDGEVYISSKKDGWIRRFVGTALPPCDFNSDGNCDGVDVDMLTAAIVDVMNGGSPDLTFDINEDDPPGRTSGGRRVNKKLKKYLYFSPFSIIFC